MSHQVEFTQEKGDERESNARVRLGWPGHRSVIRCAPAISGTYLSSYRHADVHVEDDVHVEGHVAVAVVLVGDVARIP